MIYLVSGGSGSGKSAYAEELITSLWKKDMSGELVYVATMQVLDEESKKRVEKHRQMRDGKGFRTIEQNIGIENAKIGADSFVLIECMSNLAANEMYGTGSAKEDTVDVILHGVKELHQKAKVLVIVTNEVFSDLPVDKEMRKYLECLGKINTALAKEASYVVEVVYGIPVYQKRLDRGEKVVKTNVSQF